ncbi:hypothetical protein [Candidatus Clostridium radicumherbarum]|uniref:UBA domain-containing protein n=1 Tax=Candidatus Clostridium radicumherbarum TaxID=3381662 RepID=A0ABW8TVB6_9CLOT
MVLILIGIGLLLIIFNIRAIKKEKNSFKNIFIHTEEDMEEFDVKISELRREFSETILELQKEIVILKENCQSSKSIKETINNSEDYKAEHSNDIMESEIDEVNDTHLNNLDETKIMEETEVIEENQVQFDDEIMDSKEKLSNIKENVINNDNELSNNIKIDEINKLLALGLSIEEISEKLSIGRGEVLLIKELYLR